MTPITDIQEITSYFQLGGNVVHARRYGSGHINDTYLVNTENKPGRSDFILQRMNKYVFQDPLLLLENVWRVTEHLKTKGVVCLSLVRTIDEKYYLKDEDGQYWRAYDFVPGAVTYDSVQNPNQARDAALMFGEFQKLLADLPQPRLKDTIPDFHNTPLRYEQFHAAVREDSCGRAGHCSAEIDRALSWEKDAGILVALQDAGQLPERIIHNDTKLNNVLFDQHSDAPMCVVDLDTVMPGLALHDFGDMVRTATSPSDEDETDLSLIRMQMEYYEALVEGYLVSTAGFLTEVEIDHLSVSGKIITLETGLRFLTDYLQGDKYFKTQSPDHNLDRCRAQFALAESIDEQLGAMQETVNGIAFKLKDSV